MPVHIIPEHPPSDSVDPGDIFYFPDDFVRHPITGAVLPYPQRRIVSHIADGRIWFNPVIGRKEGSVSVDDMEGAFCGIDDMKFFRTAWDVMNPP